MWRGQVDYPTFLARMLLNQYNSIEMNPNATMNVNTPSPESCVVDLRSELELQKEAERTSEKSPYVLKDDVITSFDFEDLNLTGQDAMEASDLFKVNYRIGFLWSLTGILTVNVMNSYFI